MRRVVIDPPRISLKGDKDSMTVNETCIYIQSQAACALIECAAMQAANAQSGGDLQPYDYADFIKLLDKYGIYHNAVIGAVQNSYR